MRQLELMQALLDGATLENNHGGNNPQMISSLFYNSKEKAFYVSGYGTAFGNANDRVIDLLLNPENWAVQKEVNNGK